MNTRRQTIHHFPSVWTPRAVVRALSTYRESRDALESGLISMGEGGGDTSPGNPLEKLACTVADIDQGLMKIPPCFRAVLAAYYVKGFDDLRSAARYAGTSRMTCWRLLHEGVARLAIHLCGYRAAGPQATLYIGEEAAWRKRRGA